MQVPHFHSVCCVATGEWHVTDSQALLACGGTSAPGEESRSAHRMLLEHSDEHLLVSKLGRDLQRRHVAQKRVVALAARLPLRRRLNHGGRAQLHVVVDLTRKPLHHRVERARHERVDRHQARQLAGVALVLQHATAARRCERSAPINRCVQ
eukprot:6201403-Prymnesium_polylepis.1